MVNMYFDCMDEIFYTLAYPTFVIVCFAVWYSLLRWSSYPPQVQASAESD